MTTCHAVCLTLALALPVWSSAAASPFSELVVFGDSLSDIGNISTKTAGLFPGPAYFEGRVSNGPVYVETLATGLDLSPLVSSALGGNNFAHAGAKTSGTGGIEGIVIQDIDEQVTAFLSSRVADPQALFLIFAGSNDLVDGQNDVSVPVKNLSNDITRLHTAGMRQLLVMNLPHLGHTPQFNYESTVADDMNNLSVGFNIDLGATLDTLESILTDLTIWRFDIADAFDELIAHPDAFDLVNVTDSAAPGLAPGDLAYDVSNIVENPDPYLFWDALHPTATGHRLLAEQVLAALLPEPLVGDYNKDNYITSADYTIWRDTLGDIVPSGSGADGDFSGKIEQADYDLWKVHFMSTSSSGGTTVPEPRAMLLAMGCLLTLLADARCGNRAALR